MLERAQVIWGALKEQMRSGQMCDISVQASEGERVWAHSSVLAAFSPRFPQLLSHQGVHIRRQAAANTRSHQPTKRFLEVVSTRTASELDCVRCLAQVIQFVYTETIDISAQHLAHLNALCEELQSPELFKICKQFQVEQSLKPNNQTESPLTTKHNPNKDTNHHDKNELLNATLQVETTLQVQDTQQEPPTRCPTCSFLSQSTHLMNIHSKIFHSNTYNCLTCGSRHKNVASIVTHIKQDCPHTSSTICSICLLECETNEGVASHLDEHLATKPFKCQACLRLFEQRSAWLRHLTSHVDGKVFSCSECDLKFNSTPERDKHYKTTHGPKKYVCGHCGFSAPFPYVLEKHRTKHRKPSLVCDVEDCSYTTSSEIMLVRHRAKHKLNKPHAKTEDKPNTCDVCQMKFTLPKNLRRHMKTHASQSNKLKCPHCDYVTFRKDNLNDHISCKHFSQVEQCGEVRTEPESSSLSHNTLVMNDEGDIRLVNASETNSVTLRNIGNLTGSITLDERTGVLTMNNINSGSVFLNETTGQLTYVNIENDNNSELNCFSSGPLKSLDNFKAHQVPSRTLPSEATKLDEFTGEIIKVMSPTDELFDPEQEFDSFDMDVNEESLDGFDDFDEVLFDVFTNQEDTFEMVMGLPSEASGKPHLDESTGLLTFVNPKVPLPSTSSTQGLWNDSFSGHVDPNCQMIEREYQLLLDEVTGELHSD